MRLIVRYRQEVWAEIDTFEEGGCVEHAYSLDEDMKVLDVCVDDGRLTPVPKDSLRYKRALHIAEHDMWPSWS